MGLEKGLTVGDLRGYLEMNSHIPDASPVVVNVWHDADEIEKGYMESNPVSGLYTLVLSGKVHLFLEIEQ